MTKRKGVAKAFIVLCILGVIVWTVTMSEASVFVEDNAVRVISMSASEVIVELTLPQFTIETVQGPDGATYSRIHSPGWAITARAGYPELPFKRVLLELSNQGTPKVEILQDHCETRQGYLIYPVPQQSLSDEGKPVTTFFKDADAYANSGLYPQTAATLGRPAVLRGTRVAPLDIQPFQWNPATGELKCHARMRLKVLLGGCGERISGECREVLVSGKGVPDTEREDFSQQLRREADGLSPGFEDCEYATGSPCRGLEAGSRSGWNLSPDVRGDGRSRGPVGDRPPDFSALQQGERGGHPCDGRWGELRTGRQHPVLWGGR
jgi:hypothetical protein